MTSGHDPLTPVQRQRNMSRIRAKDTKPELLLRRSLHAIGLRYRIHVRDLHGCPDLVFPRSRSVIFVHGCFWHGHDCPLFKMPATRTEFWSAKVAANQARDIKAVANLIADGWKVMTVWECALRGRARLDIAEVTTQIASWIHSGPSDLAISGKSEPTAASQPP